VVALSPFAEATPPVVHREAPGWAFGSVGGEAGLAVLGVGAFATFFLPQHWSPVEPSIVRPYDPDFDALSDLTGSAIGSLLQTTSGYLFEGAYLDVRGVSDPYEAALRAPLIDAEAVGLTSGIILGLKRITGRCRPRAWVNGHCLATGEAHEGFPSGHTGPIAAIAGAHLALALRTKDDPGLRYAPFAIAEAGAIGTGVLRVLAGAHTWDDVSVGWALGHAIGVLVSLAHPFDTVSAAGVGSPGVAPRALGLHPRPAIAWSGAF